MQGKMIKTRKRVITRRMVKEECSKVMTSEKLLTGVDLEGKELQVEGSVYAEIQMSRLEKLKHWPERRQDGRLLTGTTSLCLHKSETKPQALEGKERWTRKYTKKKCSSIKIDSS
jgi:hypothetical protein